MATTASTTADQLLQLASQDGRCELVAGELHMMSPAGWKHGRVVGRLQTIVGRFVDDHGLGVIFGAETGFLLASNPDTVRAPDLAFIATENLPIEEPKEAYWPGGPDLVVEVLSPCDKKSEVDEKTQAWLAAGAKLVWIVDPQMQTVTVYRSTTQIEVRTSADLLSGGEVLAGFQCRVADIFATSR